MKEGAPDQSEPDNSPTGSDEADAVFGGDDDVSVNYHFVMMKSVGFETRLQVRFRNRLNKTTTEIEILFIATQLLLQDEDSDEDEVEDDESDDDESLRYMTSGICCSEIIFRRVGSVPSGLVLEQNF